MISTAEPLTQPVQAAQRRLKPRHVGFALANVLFVFQGLVGYVGVLLHWLPQQPTDDIAFLCVALAYHGPFFAFWDASGERRSKVEKCRTFINWWLLTAITAVLFWELPWYYLEDDILRRGIAMDQFHEGLEYLWIFWGYGIADNRFLNGNETVLSIEFCSIHTGLLLIPTYFAMQKNKVWAYWLGAFGMAGVCYVTIVYVISDWHLGWPHISPRPYDFWVKFLLTQTPYVFYGGFAAFCAMYVGTELAIANRIREAKLVAKDA
ncbi:MAG: hypothetical protein H6718_06890 [Polyangiaceae bacterium]|nr:hypothetical protein [Myxococcales bacterium]MCB9585105.1 hypothetical protein [Polyangiaceae bacterium]